MDLEALIPIVMFLALAGVFWIAYYYKFRSRQELQQTVRTALDKGNELTPELINRLGEPEPGPHSDLRKALVWLALGIGLALCGLAVPDPSGHALQGCLAGAAFPTMIGVAYLIMWQYGSRQSA